MPWLSQVYCRWPVREGPEQTERLDQHRGRGQQQITVKHVTVNADQAVVTDQIVSDKTIATKLLTAGTDKPIGIIEPKQNEAMPVEGEG